MFHKEGQKIIFITLALVVIITLLADSIQIPWITKLIQVALVLVLVLILQFFRNPKRHTQQNENQVISPVDGKVVVIEEVEETEYFKEKRLQVSVFMSPINVHVTRYPISGKVLFSKYHPGKYLVAWHPKASTDNERTTIVVENKTVDLSAEHDEKKYHVKVPVQHKVDENSAKASYKNGVLEIVFKLVEEEKPKGKMVEVE